MLFWNLMNNYHFAINLKILDIENGTSEIKKGFSKFRTLTKSCYVDNYIHVVDNIRFNYYTRVEHHVWNITTNKITLLHTFNALEGQLDEVCCILFHQNK